VNGEDRETAGNASLDDLVGEFSLPKERIAIELNGQVVRRDRWKETVVADGDRIEIVHFVAADRPKADDNKQETVSRPQGLQFPGVRRGF